MKQPKPLHARLRAALRALWLRSPERASALRAARVDRGRYRCESCGGLFGPKAVQVDHVEACGSLRGIEDLQTFTDRLFNGAQVCLCRECHKAKTARERRQKDSKARN